MEILLVTFLVGLVGGSLAGLVGIGGGIVTAPLLLYLPQLLGLPALGMHAVSGLTITQSLFAGIFGTLGHRGAGTVDRRLAAVMSGAIAAAALAGAAGSSLLPARALLGIFTLLALTAAVLLLAPAHAAEGGSWSPGRFSVSRAAAVAGGVGLLGGAVGQGGSFILIPAVIATLRVPTRVAMGTNLPVVAAASLAGFLGKAFTGQIPTLTALALVAGVAPPALLLARVGRRLESATLRRILAALVLLACARMAVDLLR